MYMCHGQNLSKFLLLGDGHQSIGDSHYGMTRLRLSHSHVTASPRKSPGHTHGELEDVGAPQRKLAGKSRVSASF